MIGEQTPAFEAVFLQPCQFRFSECDIPPHFATVAHRFGDSFSQNRGDSLLFCNITKNPSITQARQQHFEQGKRLKLLVDTTSLTSWRKHVALRHGCSTWRLSRAGDCISRQSRVFGGGRVDVAHDLSRKQGHNGESARGGRDGVVHLPRAQGDFNNDVVIVGSASGQRAEKGAAFNTLADASRHVRTKCT